MLVHSHEDLLDSHVKLESANEVVITTVKSFQPHSSKCTSTQSSINLSCVNLCCSQASQSHVEHILVETCDDFIAMEMMSSNEKLRNSNLTSVNQRTKVVYIHLKITVRTWWKSLRWDQSLHVSNVLLKGTTGNLRANTQEQRRLPSSAQIVYSWVT